MEPTAHEAGDPEPSLTKPAAAQSADEDATVYHVVINHEEQYSIWPDYRGEPPSGWTRVGVQGVKGVCLEYINAHWTDMRPLSLRRAMAEAREPAESEVEEARDDEPDLVDLLCTGEHPVEVSLRPERTIALLEAALERAYVHVKFTGTRGGTELGFKVDRTRSTVDGATLRTGAGIARIEGTLELDYVPLRCIAHIDLATLSGTGRLHRISET